LAGRAGAGGPARLHVDRVFTVAGRGTVVTGTLWSGSVADGDMLELLPAGARVRVRGVQVHDAPVREAAAGQRVALALAGVKARDVARGDVVATPDAVGEAHVLDCVLALRDARHGERVQVHHGTRDVAARVSALGEDLWQLRLERPLLALDGDRVVVRRLSPPDTLGGGTILDAGARRHGRRPEIVERLRRRRDGVAEPVAAAVPSAPAPESPVVEPDTAAVEERLRAAGLGLLSEAQLDDERDALAALRRAGRAVRVSGRLYGHADVVAGAREQIVAAIERDGSTTLAAVRDALGISRKPAQALLEHLDAERVTRRLPDDSRVLARRGAGVGR
jgi:selenocysteine-specific elongation factor